MCLAIPGKLISISSQLDETFRIGKVSFGGIMKEVNLCMLPDAQVNDYVLVHVGVAISIIDEEEANKTFSYLQQIGEVDELQNQQS
jgi:hydrogenase expression/formation protein HypC